MSFRNFLADLRGNYSVAAATLILPIMVAIGSTVDYTLASDTRDKAHNALDAGLLAAGKFEGTLDQKAALARDFVSVQTANLAISNVAVDVTQNGQSLIGTLTADYKTFVMGIVGIPKVKLKVESEVVAGNQDPMDVVMVLDTTASLGNAGLTAVKDSAKTFAQSIFGQAVDKSKVQIGVVPFAGAVNVGTGFSATYLDAKAKSQYHGLWMEWAWIAQVNGCTPNWGGGGGGDPWDPGDGTVESNLQPRYLVPGYGDHIQFAFDELLGLRPAWAADPQDHGMPAGFKMANGGGCRFITNPDTVNYFDLYKKIGNVKWGGCVEARAEPYDTNDAAPNAKNAATLFVPYFWPDEPDSYEDWVPTYTNNYMPDATPTPWTPSSWATMDYWGRGFTVSKYNGSNISLNGAGQSKSGPNYGCPDALQPLTKNQGQIISSIENMTMAPAGGTVISEGAAWGWRVLSPAAPFTESNKDAGTKRYMIVMSDGENQISRNPRSPGKWGSDHRDSPTLSDYNAYGYLRYHRFGGDPTFDEAQIELDKRTAAICANARKAGVEIYTILFRSNDARAIKTLQDCASEKKFFFLASDAGALKNSFSSIAASIGRYRLVR